MGDEINQIRNLEEPEFDDNEDLSIDDLGLDD